MASPENANKTKIKNPLREKRMREFKIIWQKGSEVTSLNLLFNVFLTGQMKVQFAE